MKVFKTYCIEFKLRESNNGIGTIFNKFNLHFGWQPFVDFYSLQKLLKKYIRLSRRESVKSTDSVVVGRMVVVKCHSITSK